MSDELSDDEKIRRVQRLFDGGFTISSPKFFEKKEEELPEDFKVIRTQQLLAVMSGDACPRCKKEPPSKEGLCPYVMEIHNTEHRCTCCPDCVRECMLGV